MEDDVEEEVVIRKLNSNPPDKKRDGKDLDKTEKEPKRQKKLPRFKPFHRQIESLVTKPVNSEQKPQTSTRKMVKFQIGEDIFTITDSKLMDAYPEGCLLTKLYENTDKMKVSRGKTQKTIKIDGEEVRPLHLFVALEWARLSPAARNPHQVLYFLLTNCDNYQKELNHVTESRFEVTVNDVTDSIPINSMEVKLLYELYVGLEYLGCSALTETIRSVFLCLSRQNYQVMWSYGTAFIDAKVQRLVVSCKRLCSMSEFPEILKKFIIVRQNFEGFGNIIDFYRPGKNTHDPSKDR